MKKNVWLTLSLLVMAFNGFSQVVDFKVQEVHDKACFNKMGLDSINSFIGEESLLQNVFNTLSGKYTIYQLTRSVTKKGIKKDDDSDAFRHAYWQALNASEVGEYITQQFADAHESETPEGEENSSAMDHHNNEVGIELGKKNTEVSDEELADMVMGKMEDGEMVILDQNGEVVPLETPQQPEVNEPK